MLTKDNLTELEIITLRNRIRDDLASHYGIEKAEYIVDNYTLPVVVGIWKEISNKLADGYTRTKYDNVH